MANGLESMTDDQLDQQIMNMAQAQSPSDDADLDAAILEKASQLDLVQQAKQETNPLAAGVKSALDVATFGLSEEFAQGLEASRKARGQAQAEGLAEGTPEYEARISELETTIGKDLKLAREAEKAAFPTASTVGEVAGIVSPVGPLAAAGRLAGAAARGTTKALPLVGQSNIIQQAARGAAENVAIGAGAGLTDGVDDFQKDAAIGGALGALPAVVRAAFVGGKKLAPKAISVAFGPQEKAINDFIDRADDILRKDLDPAELADELTKARKAIDSELVGRLDDALPEVQSAINNLDMTSSRLSSEAYDILANSKKTFGKESIFNALRKGKSVTRGSSSDDALRAKSEIDRQISKIQAVFKPASQGDNYSAVQLKNIIRSIDEDLSGLKAAERAGERTTITRKALETARREVDRIVKKEIPEYGNKMIDVQKATITARELSDILGKELQAVRTIQNLSRPEVGLKATARNERRALEKLATLDPDVNISIERIKKLQEAQDAAKLFKDAKPQNKLIRMASASFKPEERAALVKVLETADNTQLLNQIDALSTKLQFEKEFLRGSRNVNLWAWLGLSNFGLGMGTLGAGIGAIAGGIIDKFGPAIARQILVGALKVRGMPSIQKIKKLGLSQKAEDELVDQLIRTVEGLESTKESDDPVFIPVEMRPELIDDIEASENLSPTEKAHMISSLNKSGEVKNLVKLAIGNKAPKPQPQLNYMQQKPKTPPVRLENAADFIRYKKEQKF